MRALPVALCGVLVGWGIVFWAAPQVLAGLARPVPWIAFEYLPAAPETAAACVARLKALGRYDFNLVTGEGNTFALEGWHDADAIGRALAHAARGGRSGDVYARLRTHG